jgi:hypothetical protein
MNSKLFFPKGLQDEIDQSYVKQISSYKTNWIKALLKSPTGEGYYFSEDTELNAKRENLKKHLESFAEIEQPVCHDTPTFCITPEHKENFALIESYLNELRQTNEMFDFDVQSQLSEVETSNALESKKWLPKVTVCVGMLICFRTNKIRRVAIESYGIITSIDSYSITVEPLGANGNRLEQVVVTREAYTFKKDCSISQLPVVPAVGGVAHCVQGQIQIVTA